LLFELGDSARTRCPAQLVENLGRVTGRRDEPIPVDGVDSGAKTVPSTLLGNADEVIE
jgi:hypothetical protein